MPQFDSQDESLLLYLNDAIATTRSKETSSGEKVGRRRATNDSSPISRPPVRSGTTVK